jgi:hypothetical protein
MYFIETKATSHLFYFGHHPLNMYLSLVCMAAVATELGVLKTFISADLFQVQNVNCAVFVNNS